MSTRLALGAAAALAGLAALSRRGSRSAVHRDTGRTLVVFVDVHGPHNRGHQGHLPATRRDIQELVDIDPIPYLPLYDSPAESQDGSCVGLLLEPSRIFEANYMEAEPQIPKGVQMRLYSTHDQLDLDPVRWRGSSRGGTPWFWMDHDAAAENAAGFQGGRLIAFDTRIVDFVNLDHPTAEDFEVAARYPALVTTRARGLGGRARWFFGPGHHPRDQEPKLTPMPRHLLPTIEQSWRAP
jgi:hypothetical protein